MVTRAAAKTAAVVAAPAVVAKKTPVRNPANGAAKVASKATRVAPSATPAPKAAPKAGRAAKSNPRPAPPAPDAAAPSASAEAANTVRLSAQQVWQAGLAAFAKAQEEGGRVFSKLVQEGHALQQRKQEAAHEPVADAAVADAAPSGPVADDLGKQVAGSWDKLEQVFEERVARALAKIGVPAQKELEALALRVDELSRELALLKAAPPVAKPSRKKAPAK